MTTASQDRRRERLENLDTELETLKQQFQDAIESFPGALNKLAENKEYDESLDKRMRAVADRLRNLKPEFDRLELDVEQTNRLLSSIIEVDRAMNSDSPELDRLEALLIGLERVRQVLRDALDEFVGNESDRRTLMRSLERNLHGVPQTELAVLLGVDPRTVRRWSTEGGSRDVSPRLWLVAKLAVVLSHAWTPAGSVAWFSRPRRDLNGSSPLDLLDDPSNASVLLSAARSSRNQYGT